MKSFALWIERDDKEAGTGEEVKSSVEINFNYLTDCMNMDDHDPALDIGIKYEYKEEMKNINPNIMPNVYFALCKDDGKLYLYNKNNSFNDITGYFSLYESQPYIDSITQEDIDLIIKKIKEAL